MAVSPSLDDGAAAASPMAGRSRVRRGRALALLFACGAWANAIFARPEAPAPETPAEVTAEALRFFERSVRPLLIERCYECHGAENAKPEGGLRLDSRAAVLAGGASGAVVVPGEPEKSRLIEAVRYTDPLLQMPPDGKLPDREIEVLVRWVRMGLPDPRTTAAAKKGGAAEEARPDPARWWSFQPVRATEPPSVLDRDWPAGEIDRFVLARLEAEGMRPAPAADRRTLIRRLTFDLTGLPPAPEEVKAFLADEAPDAVARLVDRLLASPRYGERWGRHWLDVVRYADTSGCNGDFPAPEAYRYRNYVIDSFNADKPYDRFIREQIAGDLLPARSDAERHEQTIATGYLAISRRFSSLAEEFHLTLDDTIDNLGKAILGLTVSCARCHAHKFDPIPQEDYYALYGIFESTRFSFPGTEIYRHTQDLVPLVSRERLEALRPQLDRMAELDAEIFSVYSRQAEMDTGEEKDRLKKRWTGLQRERDDLIKKVPPFDRAYAVIDGAGTDARLHVKGNPANLGDAVPRRFLTVLGGQQVPEAQTGSGRLELAGWLTDAANPLTARVLVNRIWQHHFGRALVRTPDDFGTRGEEPTHPGLLDFLADRFVESGWSIKSLHRRIVLSRSYQMASIEHEEFARQDPGNRLLWTFNRRRLSAEEVRDAILAVSGALDRSRGGPHPFAPEWDWRYTQHHPFVDDFETRRRTVFLMQQRIRQQPFLAVFDGADTNAATGRRNTSTSPQQALFLLNSEFAHEQARAFAGRVLREAAAPEERVERALGLALARPPSDVELEEVLEYLERMECALAAADIAPEERPLAAWASYLRVLISTSEFFFVE